MKNIKMLLIPFLVIGLFSFKTVSESNFHLNKYNKIQYNNLSMSNDGYTVDEFYKKLELDYGTLDEDGNTIEFIFIKTTLEEGKYEIELTDGPGDLYEIKGTDIFITFNGYFGYAGYGTECILKVSGGYYSSTVYKIE
jgi:hypothetical protein